MLDGPQTSPVYGLWPEHSKFRMCPTYVAGRFKMFIILLCYALQNRLVLASWSLEKENEDTSKSLDFMSNKWFNIPPGLHQVLTSIEDKLRNMDAFGHTLKLARLDFFMDQLTRRLENIETKLGALETTFDVRIKKVEEVIMGKDIKEELTNEHLSRKMSNINDKLNNKVAFLDAKIDIRTESITNKLELFQRDVQGAIDDVLEKLVKSDERIAQFESAVLTKLQMFDDIRRNFNDIHLFLKEKLMTLMKDQIVCMESRVENMTIHLIQENIQTFRKDMSRECAKIGESIEIAHKQLSNITSVFSRDNRIRSSFLTNSSLTAASNGALVKNLTLTIDRAISEGKKKFSELDSNMELYTQKIINGIQQVSKTSNEIKSFILTSIEKENNTRNLVRDEFRKLQKQIEPLPVIEPRLSQLVDQKVHELSKSVDSSFATLLVAQNTFISSCNKIQEEETHVYDILQQIVFEMRNRSVNDIYRISSDIQLHSADVEKTLSGILSSIELVGNNTAEEIRREFKTISKDLSGKCVPSGKERKNSTQVQRLLDKTYNHSDAVQFEDTKHHNYQTQ
ncbi:uncharacterized protein LOC143251257 [Tachypleus tridentatus]|uniref:uncharacterized protein LOC143251257 n=1 Tax=Tachypleus tridentatus TaxID=6853 RepID=UPI003FD31E08